MSISQERLASVIRQTGDLTPSIVRHLEQYGYMGDLDADDWNLREFVRYVRSLQTVATENPQQTPALFQSEKRSGREKSGARSSRYRRVVVSMWKWEEARRDQEVLRFRHTVLNGATIPFAELATSLPLLLEAWGERIAVARADDRYADAFKTWIETRGGAARFFSDLSQIHPSVFSDFLSGFDPALVPERWMKDIARRLAEEFAWTIYESVAVLLLDACPLLPAVRVRSQVRTTGNQKLILEVDPSATPEEISVAFQRARTELMGHRYRPLSDKHLQLAFVTYPLARRHSGGTRRKGVSTDPDLTWKKLWRRWNSSYPNISYSTESNFRRDALAAFEELFSPRYQDVDDPHGELLGTDNRSAEFLDGLANEA